MNIKLLLLLCCGIFSSFAMEQFSFEKMKTIVSMTVLVSEIVDKAVDQAEERALSVTTFSPDIFEILQNHRNLSPEVETPQETQSLPVTPMRGISVSPEKKEKPFVETFDFVRPPAVVSYSKGPFRVHRLSTPSPTNHPVWHARPVPAGKLGKLRRSSGFKRREKDKHKKF